MKHLPVIAAMFGATCSLLHSDAYAVCAAEWMYGSWRSNAERSINTLSFQGALPQDPQKERMKYLFGSHVHQIDKRVFTVRIEQHGQSATQSTTEYEVKSCTESTVTLAFRKRGWPDLVLYRTEGCYMVRSQNNFEHFCRTE